MKNLVNFKVAVKTRELLIQAIFQMLFCNQKVSKIIDQFKNEISIEKCPKNRFLGLYENLCNWNNSYYLACDKETELIGMPFEDLLEFNNLL